MPLDSIANRIASELQLDELVAVPMIPVISSNLAEVGYDGETQRLYVRFKRGAAYRYDRVPNAVFEALLQADEDEDGSVGATFNALVKRGGFRYVRL